MRTVNEIYNLIGTNILESIEEEWQKAELHVQGSSSHVKLSGIFLNQLGESKDIDVKKISFEVSFAIMELHEITTEGGENKWNRMVFKVWPDMKFDIEFVWDQDLHDEIEKYR